MHSLAPICVRDINFPYDVTLGRLEHMSQDFNYTCAVANSRGREDHMEDSHVVVAPFDGIHGQGFFGVFDGHRGPSSANYCGKHFHQRLQKVMQSNPTQSISGIFKETYQDVNIRLAQDPEVNGRSSGCTAVTAFLRIEDSNGNQSFKKSDKTVLPPLEHTTTSPAVPLVSENPCFNTDDITEDSATQSSSDQKETEADGSSSVQEASEPHRISVLQVDDSDGNQPFHGGQNSDTTLPPPEHATTSSAVLLTSENPGSNTEDITEESAIQNSPDQEERETDGLTNIRGIPKRPQQMSVLSAHFVASSKSPRPRGCTPPENSRRVLWYANTGDAHAVLCRDGVAHRLTCDHGKNTNKDGEHDISRIFRRREKEVTRSLGGSDLDQSVNEIPCTGRMELDEKDEFVILASHGLWEVVKDHEATDHVRSIKEPQEAADALIDLAKRSHYNVTAVVIRLRDPPSQDKCRGSWRGFERLLSSLHLDSSV